MPDTFDLDDGTSEDRSRPSDSAKIPSPTSAPTRRTGSGSLPGGSGRVGGGSSPRTTLPPKTSYASSGQNGIPAHQRASDLLRKHPNAGGSSDSPFAFLMADRHSTRFDDSARGLYFVTLILCVLCIGYFFYGLFGGGLSAASYDHLANADRLRILANIDLGHKVLFWSSIAWTSVFCFLFYAEDATGYFLVAITLVLQLLIPIVAKQIFISTHTADSHASRYLYKILSDVAWVPGIPGVILICVDLLRRFIIGLERAKTNRRQNMRFGGNTLKMPKTHNVFLGFCYDMPFCNPKFRAKCPIFVRKRGACWHNKRGCMCDQSIVINIMASDKPRDETLGPAKSALTEAHTQVRSNLSPAEKRERCRQCVIYNAHQEQKYKALVGVVVVSVAAALYFFSGDFLNWVVVGYHHMDTFLAALSYQHATPVVSAAGGHDSTPMASAISTQSADLGGPVSWAFLIIVLLIVLSKLFEFIEFLCFKLKI